MFLTFIQINSSWNDDYGNNFNKKKKTKIPRNAVCYDSKNVQNHDFIY